jgi:hypothetical protein
MQLHNAFRAGLFVVGHRLGDVVQPIVEREA